ncbi:hypothetical protein D3C71_1329820 [compost metagenome]
MFFNKEKFFLKKVRDQIYQGKEYLLINLFKNIFEGLREEYYEETYYGNVYYMQEMMLRSVHANNVDLNTLERGLKNEITTFFEKEDIIRDFDYEQSFHDLKSMLIYQNVLSEAQIDDLLLAAKTARVLSKE